MKKNAALDLAYATAMQSYEWAIKRMDAVDSTVEKMFLWPMTFTVGVVTILVGTKASVSFSSWWFILSIILFLAAVILALGTRIGGIVTLVHPKKLHSDWLNYSAEDFKKYAILWAGEHWEKNQIEINAKARNARICLTLITLQFAFMVAWVSNVRF